MYKGDVPMESAEVAKSAFEVLPETSKETYMKAYSQFEKWKNEKKVKCITEEAMLAYFDEISKTNKPSSLWAYYSMLKATMRVKNNIDMTNFHQLIGFLKSNSSGYQAVKAKVFSEADIQKFIFKASDAEWLDVKVVCIFAVSGALRSDQLVKMKVDDVKSYGNDLFLVRIPASKNKAPRSFTINGEFYDIVEKYVALRVPGTKDSRFFVNYQKGKCTSQVIGKNKFSRMPRKIATYLQLEDVEGYTGDSFRRTSATISANTGASMETIKRHGSSKVAEECRETEDSIDYKKRTCDIITYTITSASVDFEREQFQDPLDDPLQLDELERVGQLKSESDGLEGTLEVNGLKVECYVE